MKKGVKKGTEASNFKDSAVNKYVTVKSATKKSSSSRKSAYPNLLKDRPFNIKFI